VRLLRGQYRRKVTVVTLLFAIVPFMLFSLFYFRINWNLKVEDIVGKYRSQVEAGADNINNIYLESSMQKMNYIAGNYEINRFLQGNYDEDFTTLLSFFQNSKRIIFDAMKADNLVSSIVVYAFNDSILSGEDIRNYRDSAISVNNEEQLKARILDPNNSGAIWVIGTENQKSGGAVSTATYIYMYRKITALGKPLGIAEIKLDFKRIVEQFQFDIPRDSFIAYIAKDGSRIIDIRNNLDAQAQRDGPEAAKDETDAAREYLTGNRLPYYVIPAALSNNDSILMFIPKKFVTIQSQFDKPSNIC